MIKIYFKEIISEYFQPYSIEYGSREIEVEFGHVITEPENYSSNNYWDSMVVNSLGMSGGTNLLECGFEDGKIYQAFGSLSNLDGAEIKELGFRLKWLDDGSTAYPVIYDETIGAFIAGRVWRNRGFSKIILAVNYNLIDTSFDALLLSGLTKWELPFSRQYREGMDANKHSLFDFYIYRDETAQYSSSYVEYECMVAHTRMRYFSSWAHFITGNFMNQDKLFYAELEEELVLGNEKHNKFYFGKILEKTSDIPIVEARRQALATNIAEDAPIGIKDLEYGTDPCYWIHAYGDNFHFRNGMAISITRDGDRAYSKLTYKKEDVDYSLSQVWNHAERLSGAWGDMRPSALTCILYGGAAMPEGDKWGMVYGPMLFMSDMYNDTPASELSEFIKSQAIDENWEQLPFRALTFVQTGTADIETEQATNFYGSDYTPSRMFASYSWSGWSAIADQGQYEMGCSIYGWLAGTGRDPNAYSDIDRDIWAEIMTYEKPIKPPSGGGGSLGDGSGNRGGSGNYDDTGDSIDNEVGSGYNSSNTVAMWYLGGNSVIDGKLGKLNEWLSKWTLGNDYSARVGSIVSLKNINFVKTPAQASSGWQEIYAGNDDLGFQGVALSQYEKVSNYATFHIDPYFDSYLDMSPNTIIKLFLPYSQSIELDPEKVTGKDIAIDLVVDYFSGDLGYFIKVKEPYGWAVEYRAFGNCANEYPLTGVDYGGKTRTLTASLIGAAAAAVGVVAAPAMAATTLAGAAKVFAPVAGAALGLAATTKMQPKPDVIGTLAGTAGSMDVKYPYLTITRRKKAIVDTETFGSQYGYPSGSMGLIGDYRGYTKCQSVHLENMGYATKAEIEFIEQKLLEGVHL